MRRADARSDAPLFEETITRFWVIRQHTIVRPGGLSLRLSPFQRDARHVPVAAIADASVSTYSPLKYGGWHWGVRRTAGGNRVYRLTGDRGVEFRLTDGTHLFIGTESPADLDRAVREAKEHGGE